jgi:hypothetical protein
MRRAGLASDMAEAIDSQLRQHRHLATHSVIDLTAFHNDLAVFRLMRREFTNTLAWSCAVESIDLLFHNRRNRAFIYSPFGCADLYGRRPSARGSPVLS